MGNVSVRDISAKTGHGFKQLLRLTNAKYENITFDFSGEGAPLRLNMFHPVVDAGEQKIISYM